MTMRDASDYTPIRPELIAKKLDQVRNFELLEILEEMTEQPRLAEVMWFLAFVSRNENYPGGLRKFSKDLIAQSTDLLGTHTMQAHSAAPYPEALREAIFNEIPNKHRWDFCYDPEVERWDAAALMADDSEDAWEREEREGKARRELLEKEAREKTRHHMKDGFIELLQPIAESELAQYLLDLCERPDVRFTRPKLSGGGQRAPWYFPRIAAAILRFIDRRKVEIAAATAETAVSREIFKWLGKARSTHRSIVISGNSRFGKTEAVRTWAAMNPGLARIVETPSSGGEGELLRAVAKALGIESGPQQRGYALHAQIAFVLQQFKPVLIFEEASFLYPANFSKNTMPARLNWVRRTVMDAGIPCAFVWTPQTHRDARTRFLKATNFAIEQFDGRILRTVNLPAEIPREDLLAIARIHFRNLPAEYCEYVVSKAAATERNYCSDVSNIAALAYSNAEDAGRVEPNLGDIKAAIADVLPTADVRADSAPKRTVRQRPATSLQPQCTARETRPPGTPEEAGADLVEHEEILSINRLTSDQKQPV